MRRRNLVLLSMLRFRSRFPVILVGLVMMAGCVAYVPYGDAYAPGYRGYGYGYSGHEYGHHQHRHRRHFDHH